VAIYLKFPARPLIIERMAIKAACPKCGATIHAPDEYAGTLAKCEKCGESLTLSRQSLPVFTPAIEPVIKQPPPKVPIETMEEIVWGMRRQLIQLNERVGWILAILAIPVVIAIIAFALSLLGFVISIGH
jgi:hypothetical protein